MCASRRITLRPAALEDLTLLKYWDRQPHIIESNPNDPWDWENELAESSTWREMHIAELNGEPVGFLQIMDPYADPDRYWGEIEPGYRAIDIWIGEADKLDQGYGTEIMQMAIDRCFADPDVKFILVDPLASNIKAHRFYQHLGFKFIANRRFGGDDCAVYSLDRVSYGLDV